MEASESTFSLSSRSTPELESHKSGASFGLMALLCALPSLLSSMNSSNSTSFSIPVASSSSLVNPSSPFQYNSFLPSEYDWSHQVGSSLLDIDMESRFPSSSSISSSSSSTSGSNAPKKLEFVDSEVLGGLDVSFDASPSENGKIRVKIHTPASSSRSSSPSYTPPEDHSSSSSSLSMWAGSNASSSSLVSSAPSRVRDPFFGVGGTTADYGLGIGDAYGSDGSILTGSSIFGQDGSEFGFGSVSGEGKRRVRIALKGMPTAGGEGGEWEVQLC